MAEEENFDEDYEFGKNPKYQKYLSREAKARAEGNDALADKFQRISNIVRAPLTDYHRNFFDYLEPGYVEKNPGFVNGRQESYVGDRTIHELYTKKHSPRN